MSHHKLREFLGLVNFYRRFIPNCTEIMEPLNKLLGAPEVGTHHFTWSEESATAFTAIKAALAKATLLVHPKSYAATCIMTDASNCAVSTVLQQYIGDRWCPIAYFSGKLRPAETRYSTFDYELLGIYLAIKHFRHFVKGREFNILTDHKPLTFALSSHSDKYTPHQARHLDLLSQFTTDIRHVCGQTSGMCVGVTTLLLTHFYGHL